LFERMLAPRRRAGRWPALIVGASVAVHLALGAGLLLKNAWAVELLPLAQDAGRSTFYSAARPPGAPAAAPRSKPKPLQNAVRKRVVKDVVQPTRDPAPPEVTADASPAAADSVGTGPGGDGFAIGDGPPGAGGDTCPLPPCLTLAPPPPPPPPQAVEPRIVPDSELRASRIAGEAAIAPPDEVTSTMARDGTSEVQAVAKVCLDTGGRVSSVDLLRRTGYPAYDRRLQQKIRAWRYRPHKVGGNAVPVCTVVRFVFRLR